MTEQINFTNNFRVQPKAISQLQGIDLHYITGEVTSFIEQLKSDIVTNRQKDTYFIYLHGQCFVEYRKDIERLIKNMINQEKINGFNLTSVNAGSPSELLSYPNLVGIKVVISTIN